MGAFAVAGAAPKALVPPRGPLRRLHGGKDGVSRVCRQARAVRVMASSSSEINHDSKLDAAFAFAETYTKHSSATFYFATRLMTKGTRTKVWAIYAWCRALDETVDGVEALDAGSEFASRELNAIENRLKHVFDDKTNYAYGASENDGDAQLITTALAHTVETTPGMTVDPFLDMVTGMRQDLSDTETVFNDWNELRLYCYRVAGTVGLMTLPVLGTAEGYSIEEATPPGIDLGIALQLCNIIRDVGEDARQRKRVYIPNDMMAKHGISREEILSLAASSSETTLSTSPNYANLIEELIQLAEWHFDSATSGTKMLSPGARVPVLAAGEMYGALLQKVRDNNYDNLTRRAYTTTGEKFAVLPRVVKKAWFE